MELQAPEGGTRTVAILGPYEANPEAGIYSHASGVGEALLGRAVGEEVQLEGKTYRIARIAPVDEANVSLREVL